MRSRAFLCAASLLLSGHAMAAEPPAWLRPVTLDTAAQDSERLHLVPIQTGTLHESITAMASVTAETQRSVAIRPAGSGKVTDVRITPGQRVTHGQVLITYTDHSLHELYLQREQARAALASARVAVVETTRGYQRGRALNGTTVSIGEVQRRQATAQQADAELAAREAEIGTIEHRLAEEFTSATERIGQGEDSHLIAPVDGVVQALNTAVAANIEAGDVVALVTDLSHLWIVAWLRPQEAARLAIGGRITVHPASDDDDRLPVVAAINTIDGMVDPATGLLRVVSVVDNRDSSLRPGEMLNAQLETTRAVAGLVVPGAAIQEVDGHPVVYVRGDQNTFQPVMVKVAIETGEQAVVKGDLRAGQSVVAEGSFALKGAALLAGSSGD